MRYVVKFLAADNEVVNGIYESFDDAERVVNALVTDEDGSAESAWIEEEGNSKMHTDAVDREPVSEPPPLNELRDDVNLVKEDLVDFKHDVKELDHDLARLENEGGPPSLKKFRKK